MSLFGRREKGWDLFPEPRVVVLVVEPAPIVPRPRCTIPEFAARLGRSRRDVEGLMADLARRGPLLRAIREERNVFVTADELERYEATPRVKAGLPRA